MIDATLKDEDWKVVATVNSIPMKIVYGWIRRYNVEEIPKQRGGARNEKVVQLYIDVILKYIETDPLITLETIKQYIFRDMPIFLSTTTIHLDCQFYSIKIARQQPATLNSDEHKARRSQYVSFLMSFVGLGEYIIYIDESNCNLFLRRPFLLLHVIAGISQPGFIYWERRRGSYRKDDCCQGLRSLLRQVHKPMSDVVIVRDNVPVHVSLESVLAEEKFYGALLLRLALYSAPLNPIKDCWSIVKSVIKGS